MKYHIALGDDLTHCTQLVRDTGYYPEDVDLAATGGLVLMAVTEDGDLAGCVWLATVWRRAYLDYLAVSPEHTGTGPRLLAYARELLRDMGITEVRFEVHESNEVAQRLATVFGAKLEGPYVCGTAKIGAPNGQQED